MAYFLLNFSFFAKVVYCELKEEFKVEKYLLCENQRCAQVICNLRVPKITERYKSLERNKRFCSSCDDNCLRDEYLVLFKCKNTSIVDKTMKYLSKYLILNILSHPHMFKLIL